MEAGLSAITLYLASASSPVVATTMDRKPVSLAEGGEAGAASGAAAAAPFRESAQQVGAAAEAEAGRAQLPVCLACRLPFWPARPSFEQAARRRCVPGLLFAVSPAPSVGLREGADEPQSERRWASPPLTAPQTPGRPRISRGEVAASGLRAREGRRVPGRLFLE